MLSDAAISYSDFLNTKSSAQGGGGWGSFDPGFPQTQSAPITDARTAANTGDVADVITTQATAASVRNVVELQARIKAGGGVLVVNPNSSDYIVAVNNKTRFSVTRVASGQFEIRESQNFYYLIGAAVLIGALLLAKK